MLLAASERRAKDALLGKLMVPVNPASSVRCIQHPARVELISVDPSISSDFGQWTTLSGTPERFTTASNSPIHTPMVAATMLGAAG